MDTAAKKIARALAQSRLKLPRDIVAKKDRLAGKLTRTTPSNAAVLLAYRRMVERKEVKRNPAIEQGLLKRSIRTLSGVAPVTVITKPFPCPGRCAYCPNVLGMPKSYLPNEPAIMRAVREKFDPYRQVRGRLQILYGNGHATDKVELIILGGTWSAYPRKYQSLFIKRCFDAANGKTSPTLTAAQRQNEHVHNRIIGISIETRPEYVTEDELRFLRQLGVTRVEIGVQNIDDRVLEKNRRDHTVRETITATRLLKQAGFKVHYHLMPNLPGSTVAKDLVMFKKIYTSSDFQPDILKIYPCVVTKGTLLHRWWRQKKFRPYTDAELKRIIIAIKKITPPYVRITRLVRDIPAQSIVAGNKITNLRQMIAKEFTGCRCIRCREAGHRMGKQDAGNRPQGIVYRKQTYRASEGVEHFLSYESKDAKILYAFLRLRFNDHPEQNFIPELKNAAIIRELHTYGELTPLSKKGPVQHTGLGKKLMAAAENITRRRGIKKIAVISGVGVRPYYRRLGYRRAGTYLVKDLG
ncbi:MAG: tRNA uridine(34) 5-carboxymethylaminomethyl modification radical SAM/GNAT enzyme Elp3 [Patescibacteria group bacterium]|nr:tRNA uridine(34) 5-carboxymethylaminomethyl modification radical SAM/GNAT enzyme Elp3 [Patescibacteria group bacterium]